MCMCMVGQGGQYWLLNDYFVIKLKYIVYKYNLIQCREFPEVVISGLLIRLKSNEIAQVFFSVLDNALL